MADFFFFLDSPRIHTLHSKRNFTAMIKLEFCDGEVTLDYPGGLDVITEILMRGRQRVRVREGDVCNQEGRGQSDVTTRQGA